VQWLAWPTGKDWHPGLLRHPLALLAIWDGRWYRLVAEHGYLLLPAGQQSDPAFFPSLPIMLHAGKLIGIPVNATGLLLGNLGLLVGLLAFYQLGLTWLPEQQARRAAIYTALFPFSFVFSMVYPEGLVFAALALAGLFAVRERWLACALVAAIAALGRPSGAMIVLPVAALVAKHWSQLLPRARAQAVTAVMAAPVALTSFSAYLWWTTGNPLAWSVAETGWGRHFSLTGPYAAVVELVTAAGHHKAWLYRDGAFFLLYTACLYLAARRGVPASWTAAGALIVYLPIISGSFNSAGRFGLLALPAYWGLASIPRTDAADRGLRVACSAGLCASTFVLFLHWP
jgi:hypothetical protein